MKTVGIVGFGSFGKFLADKLSSHARVIVYSHRGAETTWTVGLEQLAREADYIIPAIPLDVYEQFFAELSPLLRPETVIVDVCSVKVRPVEILQKVIPGHKIVATHPMFGPESASRSLEGHTMVMCEEVSDADEYADIKTFAESLGLKVVEISAEEHDKSIATVQGLTFFIARLLDNLKIHEELLSTPSFERLLNLAELERHHSSELFRTIQLGNGYTAKVREDFIAEAERVNHSLEQPYDD